MYVFSFQLSIYSCCRANRLGVALLRARDRICWGVLIAAVGKNLVARPNENRISV